MSKGAYSEDLGYQVFEYVGANVIFVRRGRGSRPQLSGCEMFKDRMIWILLGVVAVDSE